MSKKPRKPVPEGYNTGVYTELEEKNFLEGLELFGRDWTKVLYIIHTLFYIINFYYSFKLMLPLGILIRSEAMLKSILLKCLETVYLYQIK